MTNQPRGELVPGGLAMVIACMRDPSDIGKIVELQKLVNNGDKYQSPASGEWQEYYDSTGPGWLCTSENIFSAVEGERGWSFYDPSHLMPINPEDDSFLLNKNKEREQQHAF